jgi:hypothetical protein
MKGQTQVIQFLIFFVVGLALFLSIGNFFRYQLDLYAEDVSGVNKRSVSSFVGAYAISQFAECKKCDNVNATFKIQNTTANFIIQVVLNNSGIVTITQPGDRGVVSSIHNLNYSFAELSGSVISTEQINLSLTKIQNKLKVCQSGAC